MEITEKGKGKIEIGRVVTTGPLRTAVITKGQIGRRYTGGIIFIGLGILSAMTFGWGGLIIGLPFTILGGHLIKKGKIKSILYKKAIAEGRIVKK